MKSNTTVVDYTVAIEGFMIGDYYKVGGTIKLTERQARDFIREGRIADPAKVKAAPARFVAPVKTVKTDKTVKPDKAGSTDTGE